MVVSAGFNSMKKLELLNPHERLEAVTGLLHKHNVGSMTCYDVKGSGRSKQESVMSREVQGHTFQNLVRGLRLK